jgi:IS5 family transposase
LPAEAVLRCGWLKQHRQLSYQELAFHLEDAAPAARSAALGVRAHRISHARRAKPPLPPRPDLLTN